MINYKVQPRGDYYHELRLPMLSLIQGTPKRVLEVGCASGQTLAYLKERGAEYTVGVEYSAEVASEAKSRSLDRIIVGDVEKLDLDFDLGTFDLLIVSHVLEHLVDPWTVLRKLKRLLRVGGQLVGALPNVRHYSVVFPLLFQGRWEYAPSGVMDWTHLRFFSRASALDLLQQAGFQVNQVIPELGGRKSRTANIVSCNLFRHFLSYAYNFSAMKTTPDSEE